MLVYLYNIHQFSNTELESLAPYCMHIKAVKTLVEAFDTEHNLTPNDFLNGNNIIVISNTSLLYIYFLL